MGGSSLKVFSIIKNVDKFINSDKDIDIFKMQNKKWYLNSSAYIVNNCKRIWNDIENSDYSYEDLALYLLYTYIFVDKIDLGIIKEKTINTVKKLFTKERLKKDEEFLIKLNQELNYDISEYFRINRFGGCLIYDELILKERLSPYFYIEYEDIVENKIENDEKEEFKKFKKILKKIKKMKKGDS